MRTSMPRLGHLLATLVVATAACGGEVIPTGAAPATPTVPVDTVGHTTKVVEVRIAPDAVTMDSAATTLVAGTVLVDGKIQQNATVEWVAEDTLIVKAQGDGHLIGRRAGQTHLFARVGSASASITVTVVKPNVVVPPVTPPVTPPVVPPVPPVTPAPPPPVVGPPVAGGGGWTYCATAGTVCDFLGLRDVRLADATGTRAVVQEGFGAVPCAVYGFAGQNPAPNQALHCDVGPYKTQTLVNPQPGMAGLGATVVVPRGAPGAAGPQTTASYGTLATTPGSGSFRTTCHLAKLAFDDPIVYPGQPGASHLHMFFGNTGVNPSSTPASLVAGGNSTCRGGTLNRTAYWVPALVDGRDGSVQLPADAIFYYKTGYHLDPRKTVAPPVGLRMISGNKAATGFQDGIGWSCVGHYTGEFVTIPACPAGDQVRLTVIFPQCWDGRNLDAPDHKSHMAKPLYNSSADYASTCPAAYPVQLPEITEHFDWPVTAATAAAVPFWRLTSDMGPGPGGLSAHADWMNGWDQATLTTIVTLCLNKEKDCGVGSLGDGRDLF